MGKMRIGKGQVSPKLGRELPKLGEKTETIIIQQVNPELLERLAKLEAKDVSDISKLTYKPQSEVKTIEKVIEKVETRTEVSVITKDKRARKHSSLVAERLQILSTKLKASDLLHDGHSIEIKDLQDYCLRLERELYELKAAEKALEAQIPEEKQEVKIPGLLYLGVTASILLSLLALILK